MGPGRIDVRQDVDRGAAALGQVGLRHGDP
jgi:hypothetical protein